MLPAFRAGLGETGYVEGQNVAIEYRWAEGRSDRLPELAADLVRRRVAVICTPSNVATLAARAATSDIPIVFVFGLDPVLTGIVSAINRPGGNATGVSFLVSALEPKRFEMLHELLPQVRLVAALINPDNPNAEDHTNDLQATARTLGLQLLILKAETVTEIDAAFATLLQQRAGALIVTSDPQFFSQRDRIVDLAERNSIPAVYPWRDFADACGLLSYGTNLIDALRQVGLYTGRILNGDSPADLPVWQPTKFELVINLKTAKTLGLTVPPMLLARADEVIE
ncbi:MAG: ABC transporter substrate-binding protein [Xanthobacteraceae bacterium]